MRILLVAHNYPRFPGDPAGAYIARLAQAARRLSHQLQVIAPHVAGAATEQDDGGVSVQRFRYAPPSLERVGYRGDARRRALLAPLHALLLPAYFGGFRRAIRRAVRSFHPDVIHAHWWFPAGWLVSRTQCRFLVTCHGSDVRLLDQSALLRHLARQVFSRAGAVTAVSGFLAKDIARYAPALRRPVAVTPMPIDLEHFARGRQVPKAEPPRILYAGNLVASKGVDLLIVAFGLLRDRGVVCRLSILGQGPEQVRLESLAERLGLAGLIDWSNFVPQDAMPAQYGASTVTVLPSRGQAEGLGLTLVEALLAGSAVIGTAVGGIPEVVVDGQTGLLAREGDAGDLAAKIERLLTDHEYRARLTECGRLRVSRTYGSAAATEGFLALYDDVAHGR